ncbi:G protein coupled receptor [Perilla frutescens var. hirtella]|nr:G protein coupled receptor [Perilla frutescens var. frutescens]KAH6775658.1 G protein coupled receptor [Perilla frutescens var. hirtella]
MADRFFPNEMPDYIPETHSASASASADSLTRLLHLPLKTLSDRLNTDALAIKDTVVKESWLGLGKRVRDFSLYTGAMGIAFLLFKAYQVTGDKTDLALSSRIIQACQAASRGSRRVTFICGEAGVCALGAVVAHHTGDENLCQHYISQFKEIKLPPDLPDELLYGRAGFLWACSFLNKHVGPNTVSSTRMRAVVDEIIRSGRQMGKENCPLMYQWHEKRYWGAAHGIAGIMNALMDVELKPDEAEDVKGTLRYMIKHRFPSGNYPSSEGNETDKLIHWCHGAPGVALTMVKAAKVFQGEEFLQAAIDAGDVVWNRGLLKRVGICHGISGNAYVFLSLYQLTGKPEYLYRAKAFACFLHDRAQTLMSEGIMHKGDRPYSLFEGIGGMASLFLDMTEPSQAKFPAYEL